MIAILFAAIMSGVYLGQLPNLQNAKVSTHRVREILNSCEVSARPFLYFLFSFGCCVFCLSSFFSFFFHFSSFFLISFSSHFYYLLKIHTLTQTRTQPVEKRSVGDTNFTIPEGNIEFRDVSFTYPTRPDNQIFEHFNLKIRAGEKVAIVGASGSGKSTITALVQRFYDPSAGQVCFSKFISLLILFLLALCVICVCVCLDLFLGTKNKLVEKKKKKGRR